MTSDNPQTAMEAARIVAKEIGNNLFNGYKEDRDPLEATILAFLTWFENEPGLEDALSQLDSEHPYNGATADMQAACAINFLKEKVSERRE